MTPAQKLMAESQDASAPELAVGTFEANEKWPLLQSLQVPLTVKIPLKALLLREVRELAPGQVLMSEWTAAEEVPLFAANVPVSWCEFAVMDGVMAARLTRIG